jgi:hypothetical protein
MISRLVSAVELALVDRAIRPRESYARSACFLLFAAEEPRTAHPNSFIGVHKVADNDGRETYKSREAPRAMVKFVPA